MGGVRGRCNDRHDRAKTPLLVRRVRLADFCNLAPPARLTATHMNTTLVAVVAVALFFDFTNGFHDAANAVATSVSTRALQPRVAVVFAAGFNFIGAFISIKVATTVGTGIVDSEAVTLKVVLAGLVGAIAWNLTTWLLGLPTSSSHALIGGVM